jgi:hypothetical protein
MLIFLLTIYYLPLNFQFLQYNFISNNKFLHLNSVFKILNLLFQFSLFSIFNLINNKSNFPFHFYFLKILKSFRLSHALLFVITYSFHQVLLLFDLNHLISYLKFPFIKVNLPQFFSQIHSHILKIDLKAVKISI